MIIVILGISAAYISGYHSLYSLGYIPRNILLPMLMFLTISSKGTIISTLVVMLFSTDELDDAIPAFRLRCICVIM